MAVALMSVLGIVLVAASGGGLVVQNGINSTLGTHTGKAFAGIISFCTGLAAISLYFLIDVVAVGSKGPTLATMRAAPWWSWVGGPLGAFYIVSTIIFAQHLGAGTLTAVSVAAQLIAAVVLDATGLVGFPKRRVHWVRLLGACLLVVGVVLMTLFRGELVDDEKHVLPAHSGPAAVKDAAQGVDQHAVEMSASSGTGGLPGKQA